MYICICIYIYLLPLEFVPQVCRCSPAFAASAQKAMLALIASNNADDDLMGGLFPTFIDIESGAYSQPYEASLGALSDSFYEILFKQWLFEGKGLSYT
jgi:hypothetical protein